MMDEIVRELCILDGGPGVRLQSCSGHPLPNRGDVIQVVEQFRAVLFPGFFGSTELDRANLPDHVGAVLDLARRALQEQIHRGLCFDCRCRNAPQACPQCTDLARDRTERFIRRLPEVRRLLLMDVQAAFEGDPAARSPEETIFCYPGVLAVTYYRLAHELHRLEVPLIPRIITEEAHGRTGIDIHPGARIGKAFFIDHGTGVVIGETCVIGDRVRLYQGVTLGARSFPLDDQGRPIKGVERHPVVEDDVIIYSGATILGRVTLGRGAEIGGNVWLTRSVPPGSRVSQRPARLMVIPPDDEGRS